MQTLKSGRRKNKVTGVPNPLKVPNDAAVWLVGWLVGSSGEKLALVGWLVGWSELVEKLSCFFGC